MTTPFPSIQPSSRIKHWPSALLALCFGFVATQTQAQIVGADDIASAPTITAALPVQITFNTSSATTIGETFPSDFIYGSKVRSTLWFKWTAATTGLARIAVTGQDFDALLVVFSSTSGSTPLVATLGQNNDFGESSGTYIVADSTVFVSATSGTTYYIMVGGNAAATSSGLGDLEITAVSRPSNDDIASATSLGVQFPVQAATVESGGAGAEVDEPGHHGNATARRSLWWSWTAQAGGLTTLLIQGTNPDNTLLPGVYTGGPVLTSLVSVATFNDGVTSNGAFFTQFNAQVGMTYYFAIDSKSTVPDSVASDRFAIALTAPLVEVLACTGIALPSSSTQVVASLGIPVLGEKTSVGFLGTLKANTTAGISTANDQILLYRTTGSQTLTTVAREANLVTGFGSETVSSLANPNPMERQGVDVITYDVVAKGLGVTSLNSKFLMRYSSGSSFTAARLGQFVSTNTLKTINQPVLGGGTGLTSVFTATLGNALSTADSAFFRGSSIMTGQNGTQLQEGRSINGLTQIGFGQIPASFKLSRSDIGQPAFVASLRSLALSATAPTVTTSTDTAVFLGDLGIVFEDQIAPRVPAAGVDNTIHFSTFGVPSVNRLGEVAFLASLRGGVGPRKINTLTDKGIFTTLGSGATTPVVTAVAREGFAAVDQLGQPLPAVFDSFIEPIIVTDSHVIFSAKLRGTEVDSTNDVGIWVWSPAGGLRKVFREGDFDVASNGTVAGMLTFAANSVSSNNAFLVDPNRLDDLFILGSLVIKGLTTSSNNLCLWHVGLNTAGNVNLPEVILRKSDSLGDPAWARKRSVTTIASFVRNGGGDGAPCPVSRNGNLAVQVGLYDSVARSSSVANILLRPAAYLSVQ